MDPKELIAALGTLADPNASDEDKAAALEKLAAHFNAMLDEQESQETPTTETDGEDKPKDEPSKEMASEDVEDKPKEEPSKEMASTLASALEQIAALKDRISKMEKASALGRAARASKPTVLPRKEPPAPKDHVVSMIEAAERNTLRNLSK